MLSAEPLNTFKSGDSLLMSPRVMLRLRVTVTLGLEYDVYDEVLW